LVACYLKDTSQLGYRISMLVDSQVEIGKILLVVYLYRSRLSATLVSTRSLAGLENNNKPFWKSQVLSAAERGRHGLDGCLADEHIALDRKILARDMASPSYAILSRIRSTLSRSVYHAYLSDIATRIIDH
jgi:hypothetical protein